MSLQWKLATNRALKAATLLTLSSTLLMGPAWSLEDKMLVLDVSGSMWGQIDGKTKIAIARDVLKEVIKDWPSETQAGLIAYGHRKKGNCTDIEVLMPIDPLNVTTFGAVVDKLTPRGKTPLSDAVRLGANELKFTEQKATVVLISDGKETCDKDPCALGLELERLGVDFTAHVIGFDVTSIDDQQGLRCLAANTGGDYYTASTDKELYEALHKATKVDASIDYPTVALHAPIEVRVGTDFTVDILAKEGLDGRVKLYSVGQPEAVAYQRIQNSAERGYKAVLLNAPDTAGEYILKFMTPDDSQTLTTRTIQVVDTDIELIAEHSVYMSSTVEVTLKAAAGHKGRIALYEKGQKAPYSYQAISTASNGDYKTLSLNTPALSGEYLLKFENTDNSTLAESPLLIEAADIAIDAPESAAIATGVSVSILAPPAILGLLQLHPLGQSIALASQRVSAAPNDGYHPIEFQLPAIAGEYEIRFVSLSNDVIATKKLIAIDYDIGLTMPSKAIKNESIVVTPFGPEGLLGKLRLESEAREIVSSTKPIEKTEKSGYKALKFKIPDKAGAYFLRYYTLRDELILEEQITVTD